MDEETIDEIKIMRGIEDPKTGERWVELCSGGASLLVPSWEFAAADKTLYKRLAKKKFPTIRDDQQKALRDKVASFQGYKTGIVADRPGWYGHHYVLPNGEVLSPPNAANKNVFVTFKTNPKCRGSGSYEQYVRAIGPIVRRQPFHLFVLGYSLAAPVMGLLEHSKLIASNTGIDLVGPKDRGKTRLLALAGASWGGDSESRRGYAEAWSGTTEGLLKKLPLFHDGFLGLDETGLGGAKTKKAAAIGEKVMRLADGGQKDRFTDEEEFARSSRFLYLSTGNAALRVFLDEHPDVADAHEIRLITVRIDEHRPHRAFEFVPDGYSTAGEAANALDQACRTYFGTLGPEFVRLLVEKRAANEHRLIGTIERLMGSFIKKAEKRFGRPIEDRIIRPFALADAAGVLAKTWKLVPPSWGKFEDAISYVLEIALAELAIHKPKQTPQEQIAEYVNANQFYDLSEGLVRFADSKFRGSGGFVKFNKAGQRELLISTERFRAIFASPRELLKELHQAALLATEKGLRFDVKRAIRRGRPPDRVHAIYIRTDSDPKTMRGVEVGDFD